MPGIPDVPESKIRDFCRKHHIKTLALFGSRLSGDHTPSSDLDVLVEFDPAHIPGFFRLISMEKELSGIFDGLKVDMRTPNDLSRYFRDEVLARRRVLYRET